VNISKTFPLSVFETPLSTKNVRLTRVGLEPSTFQLQVATFTPKPLKLDKRIQFLIRRINCLSFSKDDIIA